jgi:hypothetical protein
MLCEPRGLVILSGIGPFVYEWADTVEGPLAAQRICVERQCTSAAGHQREYESS